MNRGDRRERIFRDTADCQRFVEMLGEVCAKLGWQVHASVLRPNPFHWVVETPQPNRVAGMKGLLDTDTGRFNRRPKLFGHLSSGRSKSLIVDRSGSGYLKSVGDYVHLNPARRGSGRRDVSGGVVDADERAETAEALAAETTMTVGWIAERLSMGPRGSLNRLLSRRRKLGGQ